MKPGRCEEQAVPVSYETPVMLQFTVLGKTGKYQVDLIVKNTVYIVL